MHLILFNNVLIDMSNYSIGNEYTVIGIVRYKVEATGKHNYDGIIDF